MNTRQLQTDKNQKLYHALLGILLVCALAMMMLLSYWACKYSYYGAVDGRTRGVLVGDKTWAHIAVFFAASLCTIVTSVIAFILGVFYVCKNPYYPVGDQINTTAFAAYCRDGNFSMLSIGGYVGMYQQQKGLAILYESLFTMFGDFNYRPAKILHVVWWILTILAGYGFLKLNTDRPVFRMLYCVMMLGCFPLLF